MVRFVGAGAVLGFGLLVAGCATTAPAPDIVLSDPNYLPVSSTYRTGDLLQTSIELVSVRPWNSISVTQMKSINLANGAVLQTKVSGDVIGPLFEQAQLGELQGVFQTATATDASLAAVAAQPKPSGLLALTAIAWIGQPVTPGYMVSGSVSVATMILAPQTKQLVRSYRSVAHVDLPFGDPVLRAQALQHGVEEATHNLGKAIAQDDQLRSGVTLGLYSDFSKPVLTGQASPYDAEMNAVVRVERPGSLGSGFLISRDGLILTAQHVVGTNSSVTIGTRQGASYTGRVIATDPSRDLALVKIDDTRNDFDTLTLSPQDAPATGDDAMAIGAPLGLSWSVTKGIVSGVRQLRVAEVAQFDAPIDPGDSGGPLIDANSKRVIGVISFISNNNIGFAILAKEARSAFGGQVP